MKIWSAAFSIAVWIVAVTTSYAQDSYKWSDINCAESRLAAPPNVTCRATNIVSGGDSAGGQFRRWSYFSPTGPQLHVSLHEALSPGSYMYSRTTGPEYLKNANAVARDGLSWSDVQRHDGADYYLFKSSGGNECVGFRRYGPSRGSGNLWIMAGVNCAAKGATLTKARVNEFIESAKVR